MIVEWIHDLAEKDPRTGLALCPFAKPAYDAGRVKVVDVTGRDMLWPEVMSWVPAVGTDYEAVVVYDADYSFDYNRLEAATDQLNDLMLSAGIDLWALSHLSDAAVIFLQKLTDLDNAAAKLEKLGYYATYTAKDYERLIAERRKRRRSYEAQKENDARWRG